MAEDWSFLPLDILTVIAMKLGTIEDIVYFSVVCRLWNHVWSLVKNDWMPVPAVPWLFLAENTKDNPHCFRKIFNLNNNKCYQLRLPETFGKRCWGSTYGWIAMVDRDFDVKLFNPITKAQICFPSLKMQPEVTRYCEKFYQNRENYTNLFMRRLSRLIVLNVSQRGGHHEFIIVVLSMSRRCAAFARHGDQSWTPIFIKKNETGRVHKILDVVNMGDYAFALHDDGSMVHFNFNETRNPQHDDGSMVRLFISETPSSKLVKPKYYSPPIDDEILEEMNSVFGQYYLVQSGKDLLMVLRYKDHIMDPDEIEHNYDILYQTSFIQVVKFDPKNKIWEDIEDLGDVALFLGCNSSVCVSTVAAKCLQRSCVYFTDDEDENWLNVTGGGGHDMGVFNVINNELWQFYQSDDDTRSHYNPPIWFTPTF